MDLVHLCAVTSTSANMPLHIFFFLKLTNRWKQFQFLMTYFFLLNQSLSFWKPRFILHRLPYVDFLIWFFTAGSLLNSTSQASLSMLTFSDRWLEIPGSDFLYIFQSFFYFTIVFVKFNDILYFNFVFLLKHTNFFHQCINFLPMLQFNWIVIYPILII